MYIYDIKTKIIFADDYSVTSKKQPLFLAGMLTG
jgi:hypothetical protein